MPGENDIQSQVVLSANTSGYNQNIQQSAALTQSFGSDVDKLTSKVNNLVKTAGKTLIGISAADVATIGSATAAWASYEKQMSSLSAQAAVLTRTQNASNDTMKQYTKTVGQLRTTFGDTTSEAAQLTQTISKMTDGSQSITKLADTFERMSKATGESSSGLASSVLNLQKVMGTPQSQTGKYADQLVSLAAGANTSATALANFASQIGPVGRLIGQSQSDITGISTAFVKAGQDGYQAANVYSKFVSDIAYATQSGSPDLAKYANLVGLTVDQFKSLSGTDQIVKIFDAINRQGPQAITTLNRMGLDGARTVRTITAMSQQSGGLQESINQARQSYGDNATQIGAQQGMKGMSDEWGRLSQNMQQSWEALGRVSGPMVTSLLSGLDKVSEAFKDIMSGPFGAFVSTIGMIVAPITSTAGALLLMAAAALKVGTAFAAWRNTPMLGLREGLRGGSPIVQQADGTWGPAAGGALRIRGQQVSEVAGERPLLRGAYNVGARTGGFLRNAWTGQNGIQTNYRSIREMLEPGYQERIGLVPGTPQYEARMSRGAIAPRMLDRLAGMSATGINAFLTPSLDQMRFSNPTERMQFWRSTLPGLSNVDYRGLVGQGNQVRTAQENLAQAQQQREQVRATPGASGAERAAAANAEQVAKVQLKSAQQVEAAMIAQAAATAKSTESTTRLSVAETEASSGLTRMTGAMGTFIARVGTASIAGAGSFLKSAGGALGIGAGMGLGGSVVGAGMLGMMLYPMIKGLLPQGDQSTFKFNDISAGNDAYYAAGGLTAPSQSAAGYTSQGTSPTLNLSQARRITQGDVYQATGSNYQLTNPGLKGLTKEQAALYLSSAFPDLQNNPQALNSMSLDLVNQFGRSGAQDVLGMLRSGNLPGASTSPTRQNMLGIGTSLEYENPQFGFLANTLLGATTKGSAGTAFSTLYGYANQQTRYAPTSQAASQVQGSMVGQMAELFQAGPQFWGSESAYNEALNQFKKQYGFDPTGGKSTSDFTRGAFMPSANGMASLTVKAMNAGIGADSWNAMASLAVASPAQAKQALLKLGMPQDQVDKLGDSTSNILNALISVMAPDSSTATQTRTLSQRIGDLRGGGIFNALPSVTASLRATDNPNLLNVAGAQAYSALANRLGGAGAVRTLTGIMGRSGDPTEQNYLIAQAGLGQRQTYLQNQQPYMTGAQTVRYQTQTLRGMMAGYNPNDPNAQANLQNQAQATMSSYSQEAQTLFSMMQQQTQLNRAQQDFGLQIARSNQDFNLQRSRAEQDYQQQRRWAEADFHQQRQWAEEDFDLQRKRAEADYDQQVRRNNADFNLQRNRSESDYNLSRRRAESDFRLQQMRNEQDFHHQVDVMTEQNARNYYNIYQRTQVQNTSSASWLVANNAQQTQALNQQERNLNTLRGAGLSKDAIQQLDLTNPQNAQQLARMVDEIGNDPTLVQALNKGIAQRMDAAAKLTKDKSSQQWDEYVYQFNTATSRASQDFNKSQKRSQDDFNKQMQRSEDDFEKQMDRAGQDFNKQMDRNAEDFNTQMERNETQFETQMSRNQTQFSQTMSRNATDYATQMHRMRDDMSTQMDRAQTDMDTLANGMSEGLRGILVDATNQLHGSARTQAGEVLQAFDNLQTSLGNSGNDIMSLMASIFGFKYHPKQVPHKKEHIYVSGNNTAQDQKIENQLNRAEGGTLPGRSVGRDNLHYTDQYGNRLHLSGGEAIMVPEFVEKVGGPETIKKLNYAARYGAERAFWMGGVMPLPNASVSPHSKASYPGDVFAGDLNYPGYSDYGKPVGAWKAGTVAQMNYIGDRSYGRWVVLNHAGGQSSLYAHLSAFGPEKVGQHVTAGQTIGHVGDLGNTGTPPTSHLHFEIKGGTVNVGDVGSTGGGTPVSAAQVTTLKDFLNKKGVHSAIHDVGVSADHIKAFDGVFPRGYWTKELTQQIANVWKDAKKQYGSPGATASTTGDNYTGPVAPAPTGSNQQLVRKAMLQAGWPNQWPSLYQLVMHESGFRNTAQNPSTSAYGMFQFLDSTWAGVGGHKTSDPWLQAVYGMRYIGNRYGDPNKAWDFWQGHNWYGDGAVFNGPKTIGVGERGPEAVIPLNDKGADFIQTLLARYSAGQEARKLNTPGSSPVTVNNQQTYHVDHSTKFTGPISVSANDPSQLANALAARKRVQALTQPVLTRSA